MQTGKSRRGIEAYFGRPEDQPLITAIIIVLIAITLYVFV